MGLGERLQHAWNAFFNKDPTDEWVNAGPAYYTRPDRPRFGPGKDRSIVTAIFNRLALDVSSIKIRHVRLDENGRYISDIDSGLNECLTIQANKDQTGRAFVQDVVQSMLDEGVVAIVPYETSIDPRNKNTYDILGLRTGKVVTWYPDYVKVNMYDERDGQRKDILLPKKMVGIVENPLYAVINERNSTMQRLIRKLALLDYTDEQQSSGKLNLIIQLPYIVKTKSRQKQAEERRKEVEEQLVSSKYGVAYTDGTEKIVQLNRPVENNLMTQVEYLTNMLYSQLGITKEVLDGTANESTMLNYYNRTIEPIVSAITDEMKRKFLTKTARTQLQSIESFRDPFKLVTISVLADLADKFTRNEILTSNEVRQLIGMKPSSDPNADELRNKNMYPQEGSVQPMQQEEDPYSEEEVDESMNY